MVNSPPLRRSASAGRNAVNSNLINNTETTNNNNNGGAVKEEREEEDEPDKNATIILSADSHSTTLLQVSAAEAMNPLRRSNMEDRYIVHPAGQWGAPDDSMSYLAVYDGHGGRDIVDFLEHGLSYHMARELHHAKDDDDGGGADLKTRIERAFLMTDIHARHAGILTSGATVALCLVKSDPENNRVVVTAANAGDARIVLSSADGKATRLTQDHNAFNPDEVTRIEQAGGFLFRNRVVGILAITRSLGDHMLKPYVIGHPYVSETIVELGGQHNGNHNSNSNNGATSDSSSPFLIVACDGLWDVMADQHAVDLVRKYEKGKPSKNVAQCLVDEALRRGTTDNVTVVVAYLLNNKICYGETAEKDAS